MVTDLQPATDCPLCHGQLTVPALVLIKHRDGHWTEMVERRPCGRCRQQIPEGADAREST